jgi:hypothetical protein
MIMNSKIIFLLIVVGPLFLYGCATAKGPLFKEVPLEEHKGKALVYFYRNSWAGGAATFDLRINGGNALPLQNKGYHILILNPGVYNFTVSYKSELNAAATFDLQGNSVNYIRFRADRVGWNPMLFGSDPILGYRITSVPRDEALKVLQKCRLIVEEEKR